LESKKLIVEVSISPLNKQTVYFTFYKETLEDVFFNDDDQQKEEMS